MQTKTTGRTYAFYGWQDAGIKDACGLTPRDYYDLLSRLWSADTCAPRMRADWTPANKTLGQCSITAFLMQDLFGGSVYGVPLGDGNYHCFNEADGCVFDLTSEQFGDTRLNYENCPPQSRAAHFAKEEKRLRYERLKAALLDERGDIRPMAAADTEAVLDMMRTFYASPAVFTDGSDAIFANDVRACVDGSPFLEGYILEGAGEIRGYAMLAKSFSTEFGRPCVWIEDLYIKDAFRGRGVGKRFLAYITHKYRGCVFRLEAEEENARAVALYKKCGFTVLPYLEMIKQEDDPCFGN